MDRELKITKIIDAIENFEPLLKDAFLCLIEHQDELERLIKSEKLINPQMMKKIIGGDKINYGDGYRALLMMEYIETRRWQEQK